MIEPEKVGLSSERLIRVRPGIEKHIGPDKIAGAITLLARRGEVVHLECFGLMDRERDKPMQPNTIFRLYSMTKPIIAVALMMLYEQGHFQLSDPVSNFIPEFANLKVFAGQDESGMKLVDLDQDVTIRDLLIHTAGFSYDFLEYGPVEAMYRERLGAVFEKPLAEFVTALLELPLAFQPGTAWRYSFSYEVVGYLIEIISGQPLDVYLCNNLFEPLGMVDTGFYVPPDKLDRFAALYGSGSNQVTFTKLFEAATAGVNKLIYGPFDSLESAPHQVFRGGVGLVSTAPDFLRFCQMLLNQGELDGVRLLGRKTVELMTTNQLKTELMPIEVGGEYLSGCGYGLGFEILLDIGQSQILGSVGLYDWDGGGNTYFWIDPKEAFIGIQMAQFFPVGYYPLSRDFQVLAYQSIAD